MRFREKDWKLVAMHDPAFRRGLWYRVVGDRVELCAALCRVNRGGETCNCRASFVSDEKPPRTDVFMPGRALRPVEFDTARRYLAEKYDFPLPWRERFGMWWRKLLGKHGRSP